MARSNGRPEPEVIVNFADGLAYSKGKLEEAYRNGLLEKPVKAHKETYHAKKDDIDVLVREFEITRAQAEKALHGNENNLSKTLESLITIL
ncbi:hypothetical protein C8Q75DRAFT_801414 [Abortiporus biennis]|nr:hypothetical protein C8Q75DRAFT_801414 [Abortiporus biennis]